MRFKQVRRATTAARGAASPSPPKTKTHKLIASWVWAVFVFSLLFCLGAIFFNSWTSTGPTFFPDHLVNPVKSDPLPAFLQFSANIWEVRFPALAVSGLCVLLRFIPANNGTRLIFKAIVLYLAVRYFIWRTYSTLNFSHWTSTTFSIVLYVIEAISFLSCCLYTVQTIWSTEKRRSREADRYAEAVRSGQYCPSVDVFVPTYNEPEFIVRRTVIGCQAMEYPNKTIYILDDTRRPAMRQLAEELGCEYITRPNNEHAKAGNLNNALQQTKGEFVTVLDADFVPFKDFLTRTVGFFQRSEIALVQTPQNFYNPDYHARNLGLEHFLPNDLENFFGMLQSTRDVVNAVICCGSSYVVRRTVLEEIGGYYTRCCVEDFQTSLVMLTRGHRIVYLNETLSMGESTRTFADFIDQRLRWLQGNMQIYYCTDEVPMWTRLTFAQQSYLISQMIHCFQSVLRVVFLLTPLISVYTGISPYIANVSEIIYYFAPFFILHVCVYGWATNYRISYFWNEFYETVFCFAGCQRLWLILRSPFAKASRVTRKGVKENSKNYNLSYTMPFVVLLGSTLLILACQAWGYYQGLWVTINANSTVLVFWLLYNAVFMGLAVFSAIDQPVRRTVDRFPLRTGCTVKVGDRTYSGYTVNVSEGGAQIVLMTDDFVTSEAPAEINFVEYQCQLSARLLRVHRGQGDPQIVVEFVDVTIAQSRCLVQMLYARMTWWKHRKKPGATDSILAMLAAMLKAKPVLSRYNR
jgi:cellulose synthase (UDP-forming)